LGFIQKQQKIKFKISFCPLSKFTSFQFFNIQTFFLLFVSKQTELGKEIAKDFPVVQVMDLQAQTARH
jgi:hypothetical protein